MAFNPSAKVAAARDYGKKFNQEVVIILSVNQDGMLEYASYGETKKLCADAKELADIAMEAIQKSPAW